MNITIFSRPIRSGKTTELSSWCSTKKSVYGIITPEIENIRKLWLLPALASIDFECPAPTMATQILETAGRFHFYVAAFERANHYLMDSASVLPEWLVIDEIGKLELKDRGFHTGLSYILKQEPASNLLLVVRDSLLAEVIFKYHLKAAKVLSELKE